MRKFDESTGTAAAGVHHGATIVAVTDTDLDLAGAPKWHGRTGRLEVHYLTATDTATGTGIWLHHETVAPTDGADAYAHGWFAVFPPDAPPRYERFGPEPATTRPAETWAHTHATSMTATTAAGTSSGLDWDLHWDATASSPLWTFPRWAWQRQLLPAAQVLPTPTTTVTGTVDGKPFHGPGGVAHIHGHGNAQRWCWLHADLGDGDVLELVAATARRQVMRLLPPLPLLQLRIGGVDWPRDSLAAAPLMRAAIDKHRFAVTGIVGTRRIRVAVSLPADRCVVVGYTDPDGATATCTNSERADVSITLQGLGSRGWHNERHWRLTGTGHAEIGSRP